jgi:hypothetical protein
MEVPAKPDPIALIQHALKDAEMFHLAMGTLQQIAPLLLFTSTYNDLHEKYVEVLRVGVAPNATQDDKVTAIVTVCAMTFMSRVIEYQDLLAEAQKRKDGASHE